jgi:calcineurin-like phosphoesterase family protein
MHEELIRRFNSRVKPNDTCFIVGDFSFGGAEETAAIVKRLNGIKILIKGNHDKKTTVNKFVASLFEAKIFIAGYPVSLKHYPLKWDWKRRLWEAVKKFPKKLYKPRYLEWYPVDKGQYHIHGHTHSTERFNENQIHVGVDAWDYYPVSLKELSKYIQQREDKKKGK